MNYYSNSSPLQSLADLLKGLFMVGGFIFFLLMLFFNLSGATFFLTTSQEMKDKLNPVWQEQFEKGMKEKNGVNMKVN